MKQLFDDTIMYQFEKILRRLDAIESKIEFSKELESINDWIDEESTKRITGISKSVLYNLRKSGKLSYSRLSKRKLYYRISDLERLLNENEKAQL